MRLTVRAKRIAQNVLYYATLAVLATPWGYHARWALEELTVRVALILMVAAGFVLSGRGRCGASVGR
jgi:hypothetical protein